MLIHFVCKKIFIVFRVDIEMKKDKSKQEAKKAEYSILYKYEQKFRAFVIPKIPKFIETYHLTYLTGFFAILLFFWAYTPVNKNLIPLTISIFVLLQWATDLLDGGLGRYRNTGLVKWGFYADHFLDFIFLVSIFFAYHFYLIRMADYNLLFLLLFVFSSVGLMISSHLYFGTTQKFFTSFKKIGTSEARAVLILFNIVLMFTGKNLFITILPYLSVVSIFALFFSFYKSQRDLWKMDMALKKREKN